MPISERSLLHSADRRAGYRVGSHLLPQLALNSLLNPPFSESALVEMKPMLLRSDDHSRSHETHEGDDLVRSKTVTIDQIGTNETSGTSQTSLAMNCNTLLLDSDRLVCKLDELSYG